MSSGPFRSNLDSEVVVEGDGRVDDALGRVEGHGEDVVVLHGDSLKKVLIIEVAKEVFGGNMARTGPWSAARVLKFPHLNRSFFTIRLITSLWLKW